MKISTGKCNYSDAANMYVLSEAPTRLLTRLNGQKKVACLFVWMAVHIVKKVKAQNTRCLASKRIIMGEL